MKESDTQAICPSSRGTRGDGRRSQLGLLAVLRISAPMQPSPRRLQAPRPQETGGYSWVPKAHGIQTPSPVCRQGRQRHAVAQGRESSGFMLHYLRTRAPPQQVVQQAGRPSVCRKRCRLMSPALPSRQMLGWAQPRQTTLVPFIQNSAVSPMMCRSCT